MKHIILVVSILVLSILAFCIYKSAFHGLYFVHESEPCNSKGCFEGVMHFVALYDGATKVSRVGLSDISPSGQYAAFEDDGKIMLYKRGSGKLKNITDHRFALPETFNWDESHAKLTIAYYQENPSPIYAKHRPSIIHLN